MSEPFNFGGRNIVAVTINYNHFRFHVGDYHSPPFATARLVGDDYAPVFEVVDGDDKFAGRIIGEHNLVALICDLYDKLPEVNCD